MINFRQKEFTEYDAMRSLYVKLMKYSDRSKFGVIDTSALIPILKGNNVVIERFVISTSLFGKDKYRMYLKIGAKAKMPDEVRLPGKVYDKKLGNMELRFQNSILSPKDTLENDFNNGYNKGYKEGKNSVKSDQIIDTEPPKSDRIFKQKNNSDTFPGSLFQKEFKSKSKGNNGGGGGGGQSSYVSASFSPYVNISYSVNELLGKALKYDKKSRSLVLEFNTIEDAISALNILPFGLGYKIYLLNS